MASILVVDDEPISRRVLVTVLERQGYDVFQAGDGQAALDQAHQQRPDLVLMDMVMPVMDGWEATAQFKADPQLNAVPIIGLSGNVSTRDRERGLAAGCVHYIGKPVNFTVLADLLQRYLP